MTKKISSKKATNVIWIIVDSVRNYHTDIDDRGRIAVMDELAEHCVEFKTAITSAPSTVMSISAMMTSTPSIYMSRAFNLFDFNRSQFSSLPLMLQKRGYNTYNVIFFPEGRTFFKPMMGNICEDSWPRKANPYDFWKNETINDVLVNVLKKGVKEPFFLYLHYNCRNDPHTSDKVKTGLQLLEENGLLEDSVLVVNSDHGYPDPSRKISFMDRRKFGHDLIMTDDNILTPLFFSYPDCPKRTITTPISLLDISPTIIDLLGLPDLYREEGATPSGKSLLPIINEETLAISPLARIDNRYIFQENRIAALRDDHYKYIHSFEDNIEEFYNIQDDPGELTNLVTDKSHLDQLEKFRTLMRSQEQNILEHHTKEMELLLEDIIVDDAQHVLLLGYPHFEFIRVVHKFLANKSLETLSVLVKNESQRDKMQTHLSNCLHHVKFITRASDIQPHIDITLALITDNDPVSHYNLRKQSEHLQSDKTVYINYNLNTFPKPTFWFIPLLKVTIPQILPRLKASPKMFFTDCIIWGKKLLDQKKNTNIAKNT